MAKKLIGSLELNRIYQMDCIEGMRLLPDDSVDLIVTDPPYNIGKDKRWDKWRSVDDYVAWMTKVFRECERVLKPNGSFYWFHNDFEQIVELHRALCENTTFVFKQFIVWNKRFEGARNKGFLDGFVETGGLRNYQQMAEYCLFYTFQDETGLTRVMGYYGNFESIKRYFKEEKQRIESELGIRLKDRLKWTTHFHWFAQGQSWGMCTKERYEELRREFPGYFARPYESLRREYESLREEYEKQRYVFNNQKTHHSVWNYEIAPKLGHITPKPVELIENIIRHSSNEGAIVLDCFMGSGTTAVAASRLSRSFIGFEREPDYVKIANQRLENVCDEVAERKLTENNEM
jgi:DNA modification methylase